MEMESNPIIVKIEPGSLPFISVVDMPGPDPLSLEGEYISQSNIVDVPSHSTGNWEPCLICSSLISYSSAPSVPPMVPQGLDVDTPVNEHLWPMFLLRKVLQVPEDECGNLFRKTFGLNPSTWFKVCDLCCETVNDAFLVYSQIIQLEFNLEQLRQEVKGRLQDSLEKENGHNLEDDFVFSARNSVRGYFTTQYKPIVDRKTEPNIVVTSNIIPFSKPPKETGRSTSTLSLPIKRGIRGKYRKRLPLAQPGVSPRQKKDAEKNLKCPLCGYACARAYRLRGHMEMCSKRTRDVTRRCTKCNMKVFDPRSLRSHMLEAHPEAYKLQCTLCEEKFTKSIHLKRHIQLKHLNLKEKCPYCSKLLKGKDCLNRHILKHVEETAHIGGNSTHRSDSELNVNLFQSNLM